MYEHALVTGGAGFAGSALAIALRSGGLCKNVTAFDNLRRRGSELNLPRLAAAGVRFVHGDVRSLADLAAAGRFDLIVECSAEPSAQAGYGGSPEYLIHTNLTGCFHCLEIARESGAAFLFLSTSRVYPYSLLNDLAFRETDTRFVLEPRQNVAGASECGIGENFPLDGPRSLYGMTKLAAELMVQEYGDAYGVPFVIDRCGVLTGPWQMGKTDQGVIALWAAAHLFGRELRYIGFGGAGKQVRDFLHIDDLCDLVQLQLRDLERYRGRLFNVGGGLANSLSLAELTTLCRQVTGRGLEIPGSPENRPADVRVYITDASRLVRLSGWRPKRDAAATVVDIVDWMRREEARVRPVLAG